ncbi:MAG: hypothetical protein M1831_003129 [Alyxoria varia]|nr:MAG: hypothetical protein M1831_003129 [Alyxoria varia]
MTFSDIGKEEGNPEELGQDSQRLRRSDSTYDYGEHEDIRSVSQKEQPVGYDPSGQPEMSRTMSTQSQQTPVRKVPRRSRDGLLSSLSLLYEAQEPKHYPRSVKWFITFVIALAAVTANMGASIVYPCLKDIIYEFDTTAAIANLSVALNMLAMSLFPLWWSSFSETAGRRSIYIISFTLLAGWNCLAAVSSSIAMFIVMRFLSGGASASVQAIGAGTVADIWDVKERGRAMGIFYLGSLAGPLISPIIGGALTQGFGWRSTQWFQAIYGGVILLLITFGLPETHKKNKRKRTADDDATETQDDRLQSSASQTPIGRIPSRQSVFKKTQTAAALLHRIFVDPLKIVLYLRFPAVALTVYYASMALGCLYFVNISIEKTFTGPPYHFNSMIIGCLYLFNGLGYVVASIGGGPWADRIMRREAQKVGRFDSRGNPRFLPEDRMGENVWTAAFFMPAALIWYAWTAQEHIHWYVPMIASFFYGAGSMLLFGAVTTMLTEFMPRNSSNGVALNSCVRYIFAFLGTLLAEPLMSALGNGGLFTLLGGISLASCSVIVLMKRNGEKWRVDMDKRMA